MSDIGVSQDGFVATVEMRRPPHNFFDSELIAEIGEAFERLDADPQCRAIVLAAEGRSFCAGADFSKRMETGTVEEGSRSGAGRHLYKEAIRLFRTRKPVIAAVQGAAVGGGLFHSQSNQSWFMHCPGLVVVTPSTPYDAKGLLKSAFRGQNPVLYYEHKRLYRTIKGPVPTHDYTVPLGKAAVVREGKHVTVISYALMMHRSLEAAEKLAAEGIDVEVIDLRTLLPYDKETILKSVEKTARAVVVYESSKTMGVGAEIGAMIAEDGFSFLDAPVRRVSPPDAPQEPFAPTLAEAYLPDANRIAQAIRETVEY